MSNLTITSPFSGGATIIPNSFIEHYMVQANGEFVKIYLYLMYISENGTNLSLDKIADALSCTEADVLRALKYWEKEGLLNIMPAESAQPDFISMNMPMKPMQVSSIVTESHSLTSVQSDTESNNRSKQETAAAQHPKTSDRATALTADKIKHLKENESIAELLFIAAQYMGKPLSPTETNKILYFYDELKFSTELIEYLIEYCVSKGHRSIHYMETVAFAWKKDGINTVESAKKVTSSYHKDYYAILKALGIRGRNPIDAEIAIMKNWKEEYGFDLDLIVEACTRTILATKQPSLQYADRILKSWQEAGVRSLKDVERLDAVHEQNKSEKTKTKNSKPQNRFTNFDQRSYDYEALERELLKR